MSNSQGDMERDYDVIVVGSGAAGGWAAKILSEKGLDVLVLEAGRAIDPRQDYPDKGRWLPKKASGPRIRAALKGQHIQARGGGFCEQTKHFYVNDSENPYTLGRGSKFIWCRGRQEGGRLHGWGRISPRMSDLDFQAASSDGYGNDWPIRYQDLSPHYDTVEEFLGLYGTEEGIPHLPDGKYLGSWSMSRPEQLFKEKIEGAWPDRHVVAARIMRQASRVPATLLAAKQSGHCDFRPNAVVMNIELESGSRRASGVRFIDKETKRVETVRSRSVVLCASAIESVRILLNSGNSRYPDGICNRSGLLGRGLMDNTFVNFSGQSKDFDRMNRGGDPYDPGKGVGFYIPQFRNLHKRDAPFIRGYAITGGIGRGGRGWWMSCFGSMLSYPTNRITLNRKKTDAWGIPVPHIEMKFRRNEWEMLRDQKTTLMDIIETADLQVRAPGRRKMRARQLLLRFLMTQVSYEEGVLYPGMAIHECGGAPMGNDPKKSVLNPFNQCWDVPNVFVTDGASFVTSPAVNLTNTIMALTVRASEHIAGL